MNRHGRQGDLDPVGQQRSVIAAQDPLASVGQSVGAQAPITPLSREGQHRRLGSDRSEVLGDCDCGDLAGGHHAAHQVGLARQPRGERGRLHSRVGLSPLGCRGVGGCGGYGRSAQAQAGAAGGCHQARAATVPSSPLRVGGVPVGLAGSAGQAESRGQGQGEGDAAARVGAAGAPAAGCRQRHRLHRGRCCCLLRGCVAGVGVRRCGVGRHCCRGCPGAVRANLGSRGHGVAVVAAAGCRRGASGCRAQCLGDGIAQGCAAIAIAAIPSPRRWVHRGLEGCFVQYNNCRNIHCYDALPSLVISCVPAKSGMIVPLACVRMISQ